MLVGANKKYNTIAEFTKLDTSVTLSVARRQLSVITISYNGIDYAVFAGGYYNGNYSNTIDVFYFDSTGTFSKLDTNITLSVARYDLPATTISYNNIDYSIFAGGYSGAYNNTIDIFYFNSEGIFTKLDTSLTLSVERSSLAATTISYNGVDYAIFGGG